MLWRAFTNDDEITFITGSHRVWPARDTLGREVFIKLVSGREPSTELQILRMLNTESARKDHRNHTIPLLEFISFGADWVFVVMPRWPNQIFNHDFGTVLECFQCMEAIFEAFDFLHELGIVHNDVLAQNAGINVITNYHALFLEGLRDSSQVRYALYDFGNALIQPTHDGWSTKEINRVGHMLDLPFRHLQATIPSLGLLLDDMQQSEEGFGLTARVALQRFLEIKASLTKEQLESPVHDRMWVNKGILINLLNTPRPKDARKQSQ
ncbi:hypothetical protein H0H93_016500 [Arthromyces matolae]|nr:hypothetical protein H0H93_016500 [Arthromyces matolae]